MKLLTLITLLWCSSANALVIDTPLSDAQQEQQARALFYELRCQVCEGQSVADSDAIVARQLRSFVREQVQLGKTSSAIRGELVEQYGASILFKSYDAPTQQLPLWLFPIGCVLFGVALLIRKRAAK